MPLVKKIEVQVFDTTLIDKGYLLFAKHQFRTEGKTGIVTAITDTKITVQYHPGISNITNHFYLPVEEVAAGKWTVRWSKDLIEVYSLEAEVAGNVS